MIKIITIPNKHFFNENKLIHFKLWNFDKILLLAKERKRQRKIWKLSEIFFFLNYLINYYLVEYFTPKMLARFHCFFLMLVKFNVLFKYDTQNINLKYYPGKKTYIERDRKFAILMWIAQYIIQSIWILD